jgi:hypothetical protein
MINLMDEGVVLVEEQLTVQNFIKIYEEGEGGALVNAIANRTGAAVSTDIPMIKVGVTKKKTPIARRKLLNVKEIV